MKIVVTVAGFILIFLTGFLLYRSGQPFPVGVLTLHKLLPALAFLSTALTFCLFVRRR